MAERPRVQRYYYYYYYYTAGVPWWEAWDQLKLGLTKTMINNA